jgi:hypothetical protein
MANENNLKPFPKGRSGNPSGRAKGDIELQKIKSLTKKEVKEIGDLIVKGNLEQLKSKSNDPNASVLTVWFASVAIKSINRGDMGSLNVLLDRLIGRVKDDVEVTFPKPTIITYKGQTILLGSTMTSDEDGEL